MKLTLSRFRQKAAGALSDQRLQAALEQASGRFTDARQEALDNLAFSEEMRDQLSLIRKATLARLADHLDEFERRASAAGVQIHWAGSGEEACQIVVQIAQARGITKAVKSKSMVSEEVGVNARLAEHGIECLETDLGEWIIQLAHETPSHIIIPAIHKTRNEVRALF